MALGTPTQLATGTSTSATTTASFAAQPAGTLLILVVGSDDYRTTSGASRPESTSWILPTGGAQQTNLGHYLWYKIATGSETSVQYTIGSASPSVWAVIAVTGVDTSSPLDVSAGSTGSSGSFTTNTPSSGTTSAGNRLAIATLGAAHNPTAITGVGSWTNGYTEISDNRTSPGTGTQDAIGVAYLAFTGGGATSTAGTWTGANPDANTGIIAVFKEAAAAAVTGNATVGSSSWAGIKAASVASAVALAAAGSIAWAGVPARSVAAVAGTPNVGSLSWAGVSARSAADVVHTARVGSFAVGGVAPVLSIEDVVQGTGPASIAWAGVNATSSAIAGPATDTARVGCLSWSGLPARSAADVVAVARVGGFSLAGISAPVVKDVTNAAPPAGLSWMGLQAASTTAVVQTSPAVVGALFWAGLPAVSAGQVSAAARVASLSWAGVNAKSTSTSVDDTAYAWGARPLDRPNTASALPRPNRGGPLLTTNDYVRETNEWVPWEVTVNDVRTTSSVQFSVLPEGQRPLEWTDAVVRTFRGEATTGFVIVDLDPGWYHVYAKGSDSPYAPVIDGGIIHVT